MTINEVQLERRWPRILRYQRVVGTGAERSFNLRLFRRTCLRRREGVRPDSAVAALYFAVLPGIVWRADDCTQSGDVILSYVVKERTTSKKTNAWALIGWSSCSRRDLCADWVNGHICGWLVSYLFVSRVLLERFCGSGNLPAARCVTDICAVVCLQLIAQQEISVWTFSKQQLPVVALQDNAAHAHALFPGLLVVIFAGRGWLAFSPRACQACFGDWPEEDH